MPNWCEFSMHVVGRRENVALFVQILKYEHEKLALPRVHDVEVMNCEEYGLRSKVYLIGICAWSAYSCMLPGEWTYYNDYLKEMGTVYDHELHYHKYPKLPFEPDDHKKITNILVLSKMLELSIEIYTKETGMGFCEYYKIVNGEIVQERTGNYQEYAVFDYKDYKSMQDDYVNNGWNFNITPEDFEYAKKENTYAIVADFEEEDTIPIKPEQERVLMCRPVQDDERRLE